MDLSPIVLEGTHVRLEPLSHAHADALLNLAFDPLTHAFVRHHMIMPDGRLRDTVYYSILADEWPAVRAGLEAKLADRR